MLFVRNQISRLLERRRGQLGFQIAVFVDADNAFALGIQDIEDRKVLAGVEPDEAPGQVLRGPRNGFVEAAAQKYVDGALGVKEVDEAVNRDVPHGRKFILLSEPVLGCGESGSGPAVPHNLVRFRAEGVQVPAVCRERLGACRIKRELLRCHGFAVRINNLDPILGQGRDFGVRKLKRVAERFHALVGQREREQERVLNVQARDFFPNPVVEVEGAHQLYEPGCVGANRRGDDGCDGFDVRDGFSFFSSVLEHYNGVADGG